MPQTEEEKLEIKLARLENLIKQKTDIFLELQKKIRDTQLIAEALVNKEKEYRNLVIEKQQIEKQILEKKDELELTKRAFDTYREEFQNEIAQHTQILEGIDKDITKKKQEISSLEKIKLQTMADIEKAEKELQTAKENLKNVSDILIKKSENNKQLLIEKDKLLNEITELKNQLTQLRAETQKVEEELQAKKYTILALVKREEKLYSLEERLKELYKKAGIDIEI